MTQFLLLCIALLAAMTLGWLIKAYEDEGRGSDD